MKNLSNFQLPVSPDYPNFICSECEANFSNYAHFIQQIEQNDENWEVFLKGDEDIKTNEEFSSDCKESEYMTDGIIQEIKIEYCEDIADNVVDTNSYDALKPSSMMSNERPSKTVHIARKLAAEKKELNKLGLTPITQSNLSTEYDRTCTLCDEPTFTAMIYFYAHMRQKHPAHKRFSCDICGSKFKQKKVLANHMKERHSKFGKKHQCHYCAKLFFSGRELKAHESLHANARSHVCKLCGKSFNQKTILNMHMKSKIHNDEYETERKTKVYQYNQGRKQVIRYRCDLCVPPISFSSLEERAVHNLKHKSFECDVCKNLFVTEESLVSHKLRHSDKPRPFTCTVSIPLTTYVVNVLSNHLFRYAMQRSANWHI